MLTLCNIHNLFKEHGIAEYPCMIEVILNTKSSKCLISQHRSDIKTTTKTYIHTPKSATK